MQKFLVLVLDKAPILMGRPSVLKARFKSAVLWKLPYLFCLLPKWITQICPEMEDLISKHDDFSMRSKVKKMAALYRKQISKTIVDHYIFNKNEVKMTMKTYNSVL